ncbi:MAG TPA: hypothetical protein VGR35_03745 [Tepidisphaeraceae bacterium]|nr:hypothetical protein [Tepidisphaeraceae bacterium]
MGEPQYNPAMAIADRVWISPCRATDFLDDQTVKQLKRKVFIE